MFDLSWGEIALVGVVALIVIGPKELPGVLRGLGQALAKLRRMASDFQYQFNQALQEAEVDKVKSSISSVTDAVNTPSSTFNPIDYARDQIKSAVDEVKGTTKPADLIGPPAPDPLAAGIPAPPSYSADPAAIQNAFKATPAEPPAGFAASVKADAGAETASPAVGEAPSAAAVQPVAETPPAEEAKPKPKRTRKAEAAPADEPPATGGDEPAEKPKRARKTKA